MSNLGFYGLILAIMVCRVSAFAQTSWQDIYSDYNLIKYAICASCKDEATHKKLQEYIKCTLEILPQAKEIGQAYKDYPDSPRKCSGQAIYYAAKVAKDYLKNSAAVLAHCRKHVKDIKFGKC